MGQWTWVGLTGQQTLNYRTRLTRHWRRRLTPLGPPEGTVGEHPTCFKHLLFSGTPKRGHSNTCIERGGKGRTQSTCKKRTLLCVVLQISVFQGSLMDALLTFQIQHHPLSKRTEARVWVHLKREEALPFNRHICWSWLTSGDPPSTCLCWSTATPDVTLVCKDALHAHLFMWTYATAGCLTQCSIMKTVILPRLEEEEEDCMLVSNGTVKGKITTMCNFHRVYSATQEEETWGRAIESLIKPQPNEFSP